MIPKNNKKKFIEKYGNWWYLRDFDFLVENLANSGYNMTVERMKVIMGKKSWAVYDNYNEAVEASKKVRSALGLPLATYSDIKYAIYSPKL